MFTWTIVFHNMGKIKSITCRGSYMRVYFNGGYCTDSCARYKLPILDFNSKYNIPYSHVLNAIPYAKQLMQIINYEHVKYTPTEFTCCNFRISIGAEQLTIFSPCYIPFFSFAYIRSTEQVKLSFINTIITKKINCSYLSQLMSARIFKICAQIAVRKLCYLDEETVYRGYLELKRMIHSIPESVYLGFEEEFKQLVEKNRILLPDL